MKEQDSILARAEAAERLAAVRAASLDELAQHARELRCQLADLVDDTHGLCRNKPHPPEVLRRVATGIGGIAETLARAADGYTGARAGDVCYPSVLDDLAEHGWKPRPDRVLDGILPPIPISQLSDRRGYRRGFARGAATLTFWFTSPASFAYAASGSRGRLHTAADIAAVITANPATA